MFLPRPRERWELRVPAELPLRLRLKGAGIGGDLDLTAGPLAGLQTDGVFIGVAARLPAPRRDTEIRMSGVFNSLTLTVPEGTPVRVHGPGLPFNAVDRGVRGAEGRPGYDVSVQGVFSAVEVRHRRRHRPEPPPRAPAARTRSRSRAPARRGPASSTRGLTGQASCSRNSPKSLTKRFRTTIASTKCAASTYQTYSGWPRSVEAAVERRCR